MAGIFSLRNWVMKQLMKTDKSGIMRIPPKGKIDFGEMLVREQLFRKGVDPKSITRESQLDNILNTPVVPKSERVKPKKSGEVIEVDFGNWPEKKAVGGRTGLSYLLAEDTNERVPLKYGKRPATTKGSQLDWWELIGPEDDDPDVWLDILKSVGAYQGGGRIALGAGGMGRRAFLKLMGGAAAGIGALKAGLLKLTGKEGATVAKELTQVPIKNIDGMPAWFKPLVNKVIKEGKEAKVTEYDRLITHTTKLPESKTPITVNQDLNTGDVWVDIGEQTKHGWADGKYGQPVRLEYKAKEVIEPDVSKTGKVKSKGGEIKEEFNVEEAEFTGGHPENVKFEETTIEKFGDHGSNFDEVEEFATGLKKGKGGSGQMASGGLAKMLGE